MAGKGVISTGSEISFTRTAPATDDVTGYDGILEAEWTDPWGEVTQLGELGPTVTISEYIPVGTGEVEKRAASRNYGSMTMQAANVETDENQVLLQDAIAETPIPVVYTRLKLSTGAFRYFRAYPAKFVDNIGDANAIFMASVDLAISGKIHRKPAPTS